MTTAKRNWGLAAFYVVSTAGGILLLLGSLGGLVGEGSFLTALRSWGKDRLIPGIPGFMMALASLFLGFAFLSPVIIKLLLRMSGVAAPVAIALIGLACVCFLASLALEFANVGMPGSPQFTVLRAVATLAFFVVLLVIVVRKFLQ